MRSSLRICNWIRCHLFSYPDPYATLFCPLIFSKRYDWNVYWLHHWIVASWNKQINETSQQNCLLNKNVAGRKFRCYKFLGINIQETVQFIKFLSEMQANSAGTILTSPADWNLQRCRKSFGISCPFSFCANHFFCKSFIQDNLIMHRFIGTTQCWMDISVWLSSIFGYWHWNTSFTE